MRPDCDRDNNLIETEASLSPPYMERSSIG